MHGTARCYNRGCRLPECRAASTRAVKLYRYRTNYGARPVLVDATPTRRYIEDLMARGWSGQALADHLGIARKVLHGYRRSAKVSPRTAQRVGTMWAELHLQAPPARTAGQRQGMTRARRFGQNFPSVLAFDDLADAGERPEEAARVQHRPAEVTAAEYEHLRAFGYRDEVIAERLGITLGGLQKALRAA